MIHPHVHPRVPDQATAESARFTQFVLRSVVVGKADAWHGAADIVGADTIAAHEAELRRLQRATEGAEALLDRARHESRELLLRARKEAQELGDERQQFWQQAFDARQAELEAALGQAVTVVVESVLRSLLGSDAGLAVRASIELAMRVLSHELRRSATCHPLDLPLVKAHAARIGSMQIEEDPAVSRGQILFEGEEGEVRVDGQRVVDRLLADLRQALGPGGESAGPGR